MSIIEFRPQGSPSFDEAVPQGQPTVETPLQETDPNHLVITQRYMQRIEAYKNPPENERIPKEILPSLNVLAYHCYDGPRTPVNGTSIVEFDRVWATVPKSFDDPETFQVQGKQPSGVSVYGESTYISATSTVNKLMNKGITSVGNDITFSAKTKRDFFLTGINGSYGSPGSIPVKNEKYISYYDWSQTAVGSLMLRSDFFDTINSAPYVSVPETAGYILFPNIPYPLAYYYNTFISSQLGITGSISGTFTYGNSKLIRYIGNIWERRWVEAKT